MQEDIQQQMIEGLLHERGLSTPHHFLGLHPEEEGKKVIRLWRPGASSCHLELRGKEVEMEQVHDAGLFQCVVTHDTGLQDYKISYPNGLVAHDPYAFTSALGDLDVHLLGRGLHYEVYRILGATLSLHEGVKGTTFALWAPNASSVFLIGDFNNWDPSVLPMRFVEGIGVWELFIPGVGEGDKYKFVIRSQEGHQLDKSDPVAHFSELRPKTASIVFDVDRFHWSDEEWMHERHRHRNGALPLNIYEVHLGSWQRDEGHFINYRVSAVRLATYCKEMGYTHVELMGLLEHPLDESWGYQVTGYFAPTSRFGTPEDFQFLVNHLHKEGIGVILDWVPAHFPKDGHSLAQFDGTYLYEHADPRQGFHPHWNTHIFNYGRFEVSNFLIGSALFWLEKMHIDGLRVDGVASMLYLDYGREQGEWIPNVHGSNINLEAIEFLKHLNSALHERFADVLIFAEESTSFEGITRSVEDGGLGFDYKWNMGWMNDTLSFFQTDFAHRSHRFDALAHVMNYAYQERFTLVLSHDEVVHGKASLIAKMPGDEWEKFAGVRLLLSYMMGMPGKKLLFMGGELGQWNEWNVQEELHWHLREYERHKELHHFVKELNQFYLSESALWEQDAISEGFEWVDLSDKDNCVFSYLRKSASQSLLVVHHFLPGTLENYHLDLKNVASIRSLFSSDRKEYGGSGIMSASVEKDSEGITLALPPLSTEFFEVRFDQTGLSEAD
ncbi:MAG: 1,4-alpha-glucan branching enzyme GlgB [Chlamydiae bacterium]|nr:1,4-alpha-glucan branching enzyme GlgB [Chlamydiota bacterium]